MTIYKNKVYVQDHATSVYKKTQITIIKFYIFS